MRPLLLIAALLALASCATARPIHGGGNVVVPGTTCPYDSGGYADGCDAAPTDGAFQNPTFSTYARQSGQAWAVAHPQGWNVAGVDYPVGYSVSQAPGGALVAPQSGSYAGAASGSNFPYTNAANGCTFSTTSSASGGPAVTCVGTLPANGTGAYAGFPVIQGVDFSQNACTQLSFNVKSGQTIYVVNNNFAKGSGCTNIGKNLKGELLLVIGGNANYIVNQNVFNDLYTIPSGGAVANTITMNTSGTMTFMYDAILNSNGRPINSSSTATGGAQVKYTYIDGMDLNPLGPHAEIVGLFPGKVGFVNQTIPYQDIEFTTVLYGRNMILPAVLNSWAYIAFGGSGTSGATLTQTHYNLATLKYNTVVANKTLSTCPPGNLTCNYQGQALFDTSAAQIDVLDVEYNYIDPTGNLYCQTQDNASYLFAIAPPIWTVQPYIDDGLSTGCGAAPCHDTTAGNVLTVPQDPTRQYFKVGLGNSALSDTNNDSGSQALVGNPHIIATINAPNGEGHAGTYTIDGAPQNSQSHATVVFKGWTVVSAIDSLVYANNYSLVSNTQLGLGTNVYLNKRGNDFSSFCPGLRGP